jgi:hypothetical protein
MPQMIVDRRGNLARALRINMPFVTHWEAVYQVLCGPTAWRLEQRLFGPVHNAIQARGYLVRPELVDVIAWKHQGRFQTQMVKTARAIPVRDVRRITQAAIAAQQQWRAWRLMELPGVQAASAAAILAVADTERFTVIDFHAAEALQVLSRTPWAAVIK